MNKMCLVLAMLVSSTFADATDYDVTFGAVSAHVIKGDFNEKDHQFIGIERSVGANVDRTIGISTFVNSYYKRSVLATYNMYTNTHGSPWRAGLHVGASTGYAEEGCLAPVMKLCPFAAVSVSYTRYALVPRITYIGAAFVLSVSYRF